MRGIVKGGLNDGLGTLKSPIQSGVATVGASGLNVTISSIDPTKSVVLISTVNQNNSAAKEGCARATITSGTNINITLASTATTNAKVRWQVIEFNNVKSKQSGQKTLLLGATSGLGTVTITSIDTLKCILFSSFSTTGASASSYAMELGYELTNSTTITFEQVFNVADKIIEWQLIEFN